MAEPLVLDLFCGEGGSGEGYHRAGAKVFGVDMDDERLEHYPFDCTNDDAIAFLLDNGGDFDFIHMSPTCWGYSIATSAVKDRHTRYPRQINNVRDAAEYVGKPYVIENVKGARHEMRDPIMLCWSMFYEPGSVLDSDGTPLRMERHRMFETSFPIKVDLVCDHPRDMQVAGAYGGARRDPWEAKHVRKGGYVPPSLDVLRELMDMPWATERGCFLAVPPVYTHWLFMTWLESL